MEAAEWMPRIRQDICTGCGLCVTVCPTGALAIANNKAILLYPERCNYCTACEAICPVKAIELPYLIELGRKDKS